MTNCNLSIDGAVSAQPHSADGVGSSSIPFRAKQIGLIAAGLIILCGVWGVMRAGSITSPWLAIPLSVTPNLLIARAFTIENQSSQINGSNKVLDLVKKAASAA